MKIHPAAVRPMLMAAFLALPAVCVAQQNPLTGQMMGEQHAAPAPQHAAPTSSMPPATTVSEAPQAVADHAGISPPPAPGTDADTYAAQIGDATRQLLQMQADGHRAGRQLPMLGDEASASYRRYLKSFNHDIPEFYEAAVAKDGGNGR